MKSPLFPGQAHRSGEADCLVKPNSEIGMGSAAAPAAVRRALAPNSEASDNPKRLEHFAPHGKPRGRGSLRPRRARSPKPTSGFGLSRPNRPSSPDHPAKHRQTSARPRQLPAKPRQSLTSLRQRFPRLRHSPRNVRQSLARHRERTRNVPQQLRSVPQRLRNVPQSMANKEVQFVDC